MNSRHNNGLALSSGWRRVNRRCLCMVCGKPDWCLISADGLAVICARVQSETKCGDAGWLHRLDCGPLPFPKIQPVSSTIEKASVKELNQVYQTLLSELPLFSYHRNDLLRRGLSNVQIKDLNYCSFPYEIRDSLSRKISSLYSLNGIPGFWKDKCGIWHLAGAVGFLIPIRDIQGRIQGFQIHCDDITGGKYKWLSSANHQNGCSSGVPIHVAQPRGANRSEIWVTEGALKADIASLRLQCIVLAVAGVGNWHGVIPIIQKLAPDQIVVAYDSDKYSNETVSTHKNELIANLLQMGSKVYEADWSTKFKGLDDILVTGDICGNDRNQAH